MENTTAAQSAQRKWYNRLVGDEMAAFVFMDGKWHEVKENKVL